MLKYSERKLALTLPPGARRPLRVGAPRPARAGWYNVPLLWALRVFTLPPAGHLSVGTDYILSQLLVQLAIDPPTFSL